MRILITTLLLLFNFLVINAEAVNFCTDPLTAGAWKFEETSGDYADCTANANTGVISGTINQSATGKFNYGAGFAAVNNTTIDFGSNSVIDNIWDGGGTFALWIGLNSAGNASDLCTGSEILSKEGSADGSSVCVNADGSLKFSTKWSGGWVSWTSTTTPFSAFDGTLHHILVYFNSDSYTNNPTVLFDCSALSMTLGRDHTGETRNTDAAQNLRFGINGSNVGELNGTIDEGILYNGDLSGACSALSTNGVDGAQGGAGGGGSSDVSGGKLLNGVILNGFTIN